MDVNRRLKRQLQFYQAVVDIVKIFGETEIGDCEVDEEAVANYVSSFKFVSDMWEAETKEDIYQKLTDDIINGWPVWQFLKVSDWTKGMLERSFAREAIEKRKRLEKKYKCYTCKYLEESETSLGTLRKCRRPRDRFDMERRDYFEPKTKCKYYTKKEEHET